MDKEHAYSSCPRPPRLDCIVIMSASCVLTLPCCVLPLLDWVCWCLDQHMDLHYCLDVADVAQCPKIVKESDYSEDDFYLSVPFAVPNKCS